MSGSKPDLACCRWAKALGQTLCRDLPGKPKVLECLHRMPSDVPDYQSLRLQPTKTEHVMVGITVGITPNSQRVRGFKGVKQLHDAVRIDVCR